MSPIHRTECDKLIQVPASLVGQVPRSGATMSETPKTEAEAASDGCKCYDWGVEMRAGTFTYDDSWNIKRPDGLLRRIYYCPMCGSRLLAGNRLAGRVIGPTNDTTPRTDREVLLGGATHPNEKYVPVGLAIDLESNLADVERERASTNDMLS